jgi:antitoxin component of MazEF toxin-antitoxin module
MDRDDRLRSSEASPEYLGTRELRENLSTILDSVVREYRVVYAGNKVRGGPMAAIVPAEVLSELLVPFAFTPTAHYDAETMQYFVRVPEILADGVGDAPEDTVEVLLDNVETLISEFFERADVYMRYAEYRRMYPYYLKLSMAADRAALAQVLALGDLAWPRPRNADV